MNPSDFDSYFALRAKVDELCRARHREQADALACKAGCAACCQSLLYFSAVEISAMAFEITGWPPARRAALLKHLDRYRSEGRRKPCPLLDQQGLCLAYESRPLLCRSHGLLLCLDEPPMMGGVFSTCFLNYQSPYPDTWAQTALSQAKLGTLLFHVNGLFCRSTGRSEKRRLSALSLPALLGKRASR